MILYKIWLETRARFFLGVAFVSCICLFFISSHKNIIEQWNQEEILNPAINAGWVSLAKTDFVYFIWHFLYNDLLQLTWVIFTVILSLGGLKNEFERGTSLFTLSLPITRKSLFFQRTFVGFIEAALIALVPAIIIPLVSNLYGYTYPFSIALVHSALFIIGGLVFYSIGIFINTILKSETLPFLIGVGFVILFYFIFQPYSEEYQKPFLLKKIDLIGLMGGSSVGFSKSIVGAFISCVLFSSVLVCYSYYLIKKRDF